MKKRLLATLTLRIFAMLNASANEVTKSYCMVEIKR